MHRRGCASTEDGVCAAIGMKLQTKFHFGSRVSRVQYRRGSRSQGLGMNPLRYLALSTHPLLQALFVFARYTRCAWMSGATSAA